MLQRRLRRGDTFAYKHPTTGELVVRVCVIEIRRAGEVILGLQSADGAQVALEPILVPAESPRTATPSDARHLSETPAT